MSDNILNPKLNGKFKNVKIQPGPFHFKGQNYDFRTMDIATAEKLVEAKCAYIEKLSAATIPAAKNTPEAGK